VGGVTARVFRSSAAPATTENLDHATLGALWRGAPCHPTNSLSSAAPLQQRCRHCTKVHTIATRGRVSQTKSNKSDCLWTIFCTSLARLHGRRELGFKKIVVEFHPPTDMHLEFKERQTHGYTHTRTHILIRPIGFYTGTQGAPKVWGGVVESRHSEPLSR